MNPKYNVLKRFYFVRHGETEDNLNNVYQSPEDKLTEKGKEQALHVAERFVSMVKDGVLASDYERAIETAKIISNKIGVKVVSSELFREIRRPSDIIGKGKQEPESKRIMNEIIENESKSEWHHLDEENLFEAVDRARQALEYLRALPEENIIVVTHEMFTKILLSAMAVSEDAKAVEFYRNMRYFMIGDNTGITIAEYGNFINDNHFRLRIWNDHAHL
jgi:broad specificity phosphatase PhoE